MSEDIKVLKKDGKKGIKIAESGYCLELMIMNNGYQWIGQPIDKEILIMLRDAINEYIEMPNE